MSPVTVRPSPGRRSIFRLSPGDPARLSKSTDTTGLALATRLATLLVAALLCFGPRVAPAFVDDPMIRSLEATYGSLARDRGVRLAGLLQHLRQADIRTRLREVNRFFNEFTYRSDAALWGRDDYWATPFEFLGRHGGDCEDFVIGKYFALRALGVPDSQMALTYVIATKERQAHMVLAVRERPGAEVVFMDNNHQEILPASERSDLLVVYAFNASSSNRPQGAAGEPSGAPGAVRVGSPQMNRLLASLRAQNERAAAAHPGTPGSTAGYPAFGPSPSIR